MCRASRVLPWLLLSSLVCLAGCGKEDEEAVLPPGIPTKVSAEAGAREATVTWTAPAAQKGAPVHAYTVTSTPGGITASAPGTATRVVVSGLANNTTYTFTVQASNPVGAGPMSVPSQPITTPDLPGAPELLSVTAENTRATVTWRSPPSTGGSPITGYVLTAKPGDRSTTVSGSVTTATLDGLSPDTRYAFTVRATNAVGDGPHSETLMERTPCGDVSLSTSGEVAVGAQPGKVAAADFNGDGKVDLAVSNAEGASVSLLLGQGDGHFLAETRLPVGSAPRDVSAADFNGDGKLDLAVLNTQDSTVGVLLGKGDGTFDAQRTFTTGTAPQAMTAQDFDGDGKLDLFTADSSIPLRSYTATWLRGNGDGTFTAKSYNTGFVAYGVTGMDANGDGKLDLVLPDFYDSVINVYLGAGDGTFSSRTSISTGTNPEALQAADLDLDGKPELVATWTGTLTTYQSQGDGTFVWGDYQDLGGRPKALALADLDGDGRLDAVTSFADTLTVSVLQGRDAGTFSTPRDFTVGDPSGGLALADFNGDGHPDVAVTQKGGNSVRVMLTRCGP